MEPGFCNPTDVSSFPCPWPLIAGMLPAVSGSPLARKLNGDNIDSWVGRRVYCGYLFKCLPRGRVHGSHSPNVSSFAFAENSSCIVCKPLRHTGQNCSQGELLNNTVYLYSEKIEIITL